MTNYYSKKKYSPEMRLFSPVGDRLYITKKERDKFLDSASILEPIKRMYCYILAFTGCRASEALEITFDRIDFDGDKILIRTLKQRKEDDQGNLKQPKYRNIKVPKHLMSSLDLVFSIRRAQKKGKDKGVFLFSKCRTTFYRAVKDVMAHAGIKGEMATCKGLRHGYAISMLTADKPLPLHVLSRNLGHSSSKTTEIYLQVTGEEYDKLVDDAWGSQQ